MEKNEMIVSIEEVLLNRILSEQTKEDTEELVLEKVFPEGTPRAQGDSVVALKVFDECYSELTAKIEAALEGRLSLTLKEAILKHFGPGAQFFSPEATAFVYSSDDATIKILSITCDSYCGAQILALMWRAHNRAQSQEGSARQAVWANAIEEAKVIYHG